MSHRTIARAVPVALIALAAASAARAQTCTNAGVASATCSVVATATATVQHVVSMNIGSTALGLSGITAIANYNASGVATMNDLNLHTITVRANRSWTVSVNGNAATWTFTPAGGTTDPSKVVGDLGWSATGAAPFTAMTTAAATVATGSATNSSTIPMSYQTTYNITKDVPGSYSLGLTYTISAP
jgi:hypothetical protein